MLKIDFTRIENIVVAKVLELPELRGKEKKWFVGVSAINIGDTVVDKKRYDIIYLPLGLNSFMNCTGIYICDNKQKSMCLDCKAEEHAEKYIKAMQEIIDKFNKRL